MTRATSEDAEDELSGAPTAAAVRRPVPSLSSVEVPGHELLEVLGRGGMGEVWRARRLSDGHPVAVKLLRGAKALSPDYAVRFERETTALLSLEHPGIVRLFERGRLADGFFFTMELVQGPNLREVFRSHPLPPPEALRLVRDVARAMQHAHTRGVVHRDLKPENVLLDDAGRTKVADFGVALLEQTSLPRITGSGLGMGTLGYMAPEQATNARHVDRRADIYSLGVILYELLCGELPSGIFRLPSQRLPEVGQRVDTLIQRAVASSPQDRWGSMDALAQAIDEVLRELTRPEATAPQPAPEQVAEELAAPHVLRLQLPRWVEAEHVESVRTAVQGRLGEGPGLAVGYDLSGCVDLGPAAARQLSELHRAHTAQLTRVGFCAPIPRSRGAALVVASSVASLPARVFVSRPRFLEFLVRGHAAGPEQERLVRAAHAHGQGHLGRVWRDAVNTFGRLRGAVWMAQHLVALARARLRFGTLGYHLLMAVCSLLNGAAHCIHDHVVRFSIAYHQRHRRVFGLSDAALLKLADTPAADLLQLLHPPLLEAGLAREAELLRRVFALKLEDRPPEGHEDALLERLISWSDALNPTCIAECWALPHVHPERTGPDETDHALESLKTR